MTLLGATLLILDVGLIMVFALAYSIDIPTFHLDGAFQTASALFRLADGQLPGRDFFPYLGVGVTTFLYPVFKLFGGGMAASVAAAYAWTAFSFAFSFAVITALIARTRKLFIGILSGSIFLGWSLWLPHNFFIFVVDRFSPGNSLRPIRGFIPYLVVFLVYAVIHLTARSKIKVSSSYYAIAAMAGAVFFWSPDFGIPSTFFILFFCLIWAWKNGHLQVTPGIKIIFFAILSWTVTLMAFTGFHPQGYLQYLFLDMPSDQWWYFGPWGEDSRIFSFADLVPKLLQDFGFRGGMGWWWMIGPAGLIITLIVRPTLGRFLLLLIGLILASGGALASIGGHRDIGYIGSFHFWCQSITVIGGCIVIYWLIAGRIRQIIAAKHLPEYSASLVGYLSAGVLIIFLGNVLVETSRSYLSAKNGAKTNSTKFYVSELGGYLPVDWREHVELARKTQGESAIEEYWGIWSAVAHNHNKLPVDAVIHALGTTRTKFSDSMAERPAYVVTSSKQIAGPWLGWNLSANWWFYKFLLERYSYHQSSPSTLVWKLKDESGVKDWPQVNCSVAGGIRVEADHAGYYPELCIKRAKYIASI